MRGNGPGDRLLQRSDWQYSFGARSDDVKIFGSNSSAPPYIPFASRDRDEISTPLRNKIVTLLGDRRSESFC